MGMSDSLFFRRSGLSVMIDTCVEIKILRRVPHWLISTQIDTMSVSVTPGLTVLIRMPFAASGSMRPCCMLLRAPFDMLYNNGRPK